jgi:hypothetical protein
MKIVLLKVVHSLNVYHHTKFHGPTITGASFHPPQKFESPQFWNIYSYGIKTSGFEVTSNGMNAPKSTDSVSEIYLNKVTKT